MAYGKVVVEIEVEFDRDLGEKVEKYDVAVYADSEEALDFVVENMDEKYNGFSAGYREEFDGVKGCWGFEMFFFEDKEDVKKFKAHVARLLKKA